MIKITGGAFGEHNFSWSRRGQGWDGLRSEKGIRSGMVGNSLEVERLFMFPHCRVQKGILAVHLSSNGILVTLSHCCLGSCSFHHSELVV